MRCLACNKELSDKEASKKYKNHLEIKNPEERYIGLCSGCLICAELDDEELIHESIDIEED